MPRIAKSLATLRDQVNARWPNRSKSSDGWIGDTAHAARRSDHNPNSADVVQALDLTHDPARGFDSYKFAESLRQNRDPRIKYVISNGRIFSSVVNPWQWRPYNGPNKHAHHIHVSVDGDPALYDDPRPWSIKAAAPKPGLHADIVATVFGGPSDSMSGTQTAYAALVAPNWWDRPGVALPARINDRPLPQVRVTHNGRSVICPVIDVGPWNTRDPYWINGARPQAESGVDMSGRRTNLAGIDLTPAAANAIGLRGKGVVDWEFIKENAMSEDQASGQTGPTLSMNNEALAKALGEMLLPLLLSALLQGGKLQLPPNVVPQLPPPAPEPPPVAQPPADVPLMQRPGVGLGIFGLVATAIAQAFGVVGPPVDTAAQAATTAGQVLPVLSGGTALLGLTGTWGTVARVGLSVLGALLQNSQKR